MSEHLVADSFVLSNDSKEKISLFKKVYPMRR